MWSHLDEPCGDLAAPMRRGHCEFEGDREPGGTLDIDPIESFQ